MGARTRDVSDGEVPMAGDPVRIWAIGRRAARASGPPDAREGVELVAFDEFLGDGDVANVDMVLSPMVGDGFDCLDVAQLLFARGYNGRYRVMAPNLPNPGIIRQEVRTLCPGLDFDIVTEDALSQRIAS
jgi:hypothetical protein